MIQMFHVYKAYRRDATALMDINLKVEKGEFICLTGASGAGKTTLLKLIFCDELVNEGQILVDGRNVHRLNRSGVSELRRSIGVVFQDFRLIQNRNVFQNVAVPLHIQGFPPTTIEKRVMGILKLVGLEQRAMSLPMRLSGGEQQRVAMARALVNQPKILLADEPTGNLDPKLSMEILDLLREINLRGTTILLATHDQDVIGRIPGRRFELREGRLLSA